MKNALRVSLNEDDGGLSFITLFCIQTRKTILGPLLFVHLMLSFWG